MLKEYDGGDEGRDKLYRYHADGLSVDKTEGHRAGRVPPELERRRDTRPCLLWVAKGQP
jgi:hypothetical protein